MSRALLSLVLSGPSSPRPSQRLRRKHAPAPWTGDRQSGEVKSLAYLEMRVALLQEHLALADAGNDTAGLERRVAQCHAALDRCSRCDFGPEMRRFLEVKIFRLESELSVAIRGAESGVFSFFR